MKTYIFLFFIFYLQSVHGQNTVEPLPDIESKGLTISEPVDTLVYTTVQVPPGFPSGPKGLKAFTDQKVKEIIPKINGTVSFRITVELDGSLTNRRVINQY